MLQEEMINTIDVLLNENDFEQCTFEELKGEEVDLSGKTFYDCDFSRVSFENVDLSEAAFDDCRFERCDLTMAKLNDTKLRGVEFGESKLMGIDWSLAGGMTFQVGFDGCVISYGSFVDLNMADAKIVRCKARETVFADVNLTKANFLETDLLEARFLGCDLTKADFSLAVNYAINPNENRLNKTKVSREFAVELAEMLGVVVE